MAWQWFRNMKHGHHFSSYSFMEMAPTTFCSKDLVTSTTFMVLSSSTTSSTFLTAAWMILRTSLSDFQTELMAFSLTFLKACSFLLSSSSSEL